ncbi:peptidase M20 [Haloarcula taiwanensis]|uniref:Peptidase M20 n=1 Tax=Haloarcula taiwanensis TaxID=1932004 RepID=A0A2H5A0Q0_9EURY|nr:MULTISPECIES: M20/M25/M40 family metallo-hydrolase [Haloarcula]AUG48303.1 peptidase M20 [Haloarcula taiwanensis]RLM39660.1 M20 family peptidase [Haloarcula sp. Atlit-120R]RLM47634.1 M20 family peptidase [Haloarcula sp. Atlit-47R]
MSVIDLTEDLVAIPSHADESTAGAFIAEWLREHTTGAVNRDSHGNVIACKGQGDDTLALVGHHDVVPPDDSQVDADGEYVVEQRDGRLYGRGTADMKGCVAAAMLAFRDADPAGELVFASFVGEEQGGVGCQAAIEDGFAPDYAVVGEGSTGYSAPGTTDVAVAHKGRRGSTLVAEGAAAHASEPDAGANAIYRATDAVDVVRDLDFPETTVLGHELSGSVAVTEIDGGSAWNVIPERCEVTVDERTVPGERAPLDRAEAVDGVTWRVDQDLPPMACGDADFADRVLDAAADAQDSTPEHVVKPHATDAGWLAQAGTDCVIVGAAEPGEAHTADESVSLAVLQRCREVYERVAESWPSE